MTLRARASSPINSRARQFAYYFARASLSRNSQPRMLVCLLIRECQLVQNTTEAELQLGPYNLVVLLALLYLGYIQFWHGALPIF